MSAKVKRVKLPTLPQVNPARMPPVGSEKTTESNANGHKKSKDDSVGQPIQGNRRQHGGEFEVFAAGHEPRPRHRSEAERHQDRQEIAGHDRAEEIEGADRAQRMKQLPPLPAAHELLAYDGERNERNVPRLSAGQNGKKTLEVEAAQHPGECGHPEEPPDPGQPAAPTRLCRGDLRHSRAWTRSSMAM
jgi:hypothetical protein